LSDAPEEAEHHRQLTVIGTIVVASLIVLFVLIYVVICCRRRRKKLKAWEQWQKENEVAEQNGEDWMEATEKEPKAAQSKLPMDSLPDVPYKHEHPEIISPRAVMSAVHDACCGGTTASRVQPLPPLEMYLPYGTMHSWQEGQDNMQLVERPPRPPPALQENKLVKQRDEPCFEEPSHTCNACEVSWVRFLACRAAAEKQAGTPMQAVPKGPRHGSAPVETIDMPNPNAVIFGGKGKGDSILPRVPKMPGPEALKLWDSTVL